MAKTGSLSINSENIFPIIKKWLYSDHDIFYRELVSNGCDAITKLKKLALMGEYEEPENPEYKVLVTVNPTDKTIKIEDNGLGMTEEEVDEYINQIAFSGAQDFLNKYKDKAGEDQIIGHFGLGFYSAFMVADRVEINTLSYKADAKPVHWVSDGGTEFEMTDGDKAGHGTVITLYLNEDSTEFANEFRAREVLQKYCAFMPVEIYVNDETREPMPETIEADELLDSDVIIETIVEEETQKYKIEQRPVPVNDTKPLWNKHPNECTEDEYKDFYRKVFQDYKEPLFWIHLNMDYPFNLKGILYFPKINMEYESIEGKIKLFNNQVFIADNIKEVIPEFLMLLKGTIDCPDLPLNVSRSALQNDGFVKKISDYITKKVADKLSGMCKTDRETYEKYWDDINPFIKFGCLKDEKFADKMNDYIIFKNLEDKYVTLKDYLEIAKEKNHENQVFYVTDAIEQSQYINMFKDAELEAVYLTQAIDNPFMSQLEYKNEGVKFQRIDADVNDIFKEADTETAEDVKTSLSDLFKSALGMEQLDVKVENLKNAGLASMITVSEESRRIQEMMKMYSAQGMGMGADMFPVSETLVLNANNSLVKYVLAHKDGEHTAKICEQLYDLAKLAHGSLTPERMTKFIARSGEIMMLMTG
ncbi:MAG: molecular chaperone HtpG, partial [Lachnospiraceae bacterium]|nr:molecular chaperone HtpG [Lachnospiraceae bacterium]